jgi:GT2 family glycosyltransferase
MGFAEGCNIGVRASKAKYMAILGNDSIVDKNWLKEMIKVMKQEQKTAIVGSEVNSLGSFYEKRKTLGAVMSIFGEPVHIKPKDKSFTFLVSGCSMLFRKSVIKEPFDKDYFAYGEDVALSWLVNLKGYKTRMAHQSRLDHLGGVVRKKIPKLVEFHAEKNKMMNMLIFYESKTLIKMAPLITLNILATLIISIPKSRFLTRMKSYFWLIKNYKKLIKKRRRIQKQRRLSDDEIFKNITCRSAHTNNFLVNNLLKFYCFMFGLHVLELRK